MSNIDERLIIDKKEYIDLIAEKHYLLGRAEGLRDQVDMLGKLLLDMLNQK